MELPHVTSGKSPENVHIEYASKADSSTASANVRVEGEIFQGINKQTILAFLVCLSVDCKEETH